MKKSLLALTVLLFSQFVQAQTSSIVINRLNTVTIKRQGGQIIDNKDYPITIDYSTQCNSASCQNQKLAFAVSDEFIPTQCTTHDNAANAPRATQLKEAFGTDSHKATFSRGRTRTLNWDNWMAAYELDDKTSTGTATITLNDLSKAPENFYIHAKHSTDDSTCVTSAQVTVKTQDNDFVGITGLVDIALDNDALSAHNRNICIYSSTHNATLDFQTINNFKLKSNPTDTKGIGYYISLGVDENPEYGSGNTADGTISKNGLAQHNNQTSWSVTHKEKCDGGINTFFTVAIAMSVPELRKFRAGVYSDRVYITVSTI